MQAEQPVVETRERSVRETWPQCLGGPNETQASLFRLRAEEYLELTFIECSARLGTVYYVCHLIQCFNRVRCRFSYYARFAKEGTRRQAVFHVAWSLF